MLNILIFILLPTLISSYRADYSLDKDRRACRTEEITFIPNDNQFYDEPIQLSFDSAMTLNHVLVTKIVEEECGFRDKEHSHKRGKRSMASGRKFDLNQYFLDFYRGIENSLKPELLKGIKNVVDRLKHLKTPMGQTSGMDKFFIQMWKDLEELRAQYNDEHFDLMLEQTFRTSIQLLIQNSELSDILLHHPTILNHIKRRIPVTNAQLLSEIKVSNVKCHHLNSQIVLFFKLRIPVIEKKTIDKCDDIGTITQRTYQYYELPAATFKRNGHIYKVEFDRCYFENFIFCPFGTIRPTDCSKENVKNCPIKKDKNPIIRELQNGFAVYGDFTQVFTSKNDQHSHMYIRPYSLYHIVPQSGETILIDQYELKQRTQSTMTIVNQM